MTEPTAEQPQVTATVSPAAPPRSRWGAIPHHLGRARTSTVVLSLLFLAIGALWINVRPDPDPVPAGTGSVVEQPVAPTIPLVPTPPAPTTEPAPTTAPELTPTSEAPTSSSTDVPTSTETSTRFPTTTSEPSEPLPDTTTTPAG